MRDGNRNGVLGHFWLIFNHFGAGHPCTRSSVYIDEFLNFIGSDMIIIHNAPFDLSFLNNELFKAKKETTCEKAL